MNINWGPGIKDFYGYWSEAPVVQQTFEALEREFESNNDASIDIAKAMVECACKVIIENCDGKYKLDEYQISKTRQIKSWVEFAFKSLKINEDENNPFHKIISKYIELAQVLGKFRNDVGIVGHGKRGHDPQLPYSYRLASIKIADTIIAFLHNIYLGFEKNIEFTKEPYEKFAEENNLIDKYTKCELTTYEDEDGNSKLGILIRWTKNEVVIPITLSRLLYEEDRIAYKDVLDDCKLEELVQIAASQRIKANHKEG